LSCPKKLPFSPPQSDHTGCGGEFLLSHVGDLGLSELVATDNHLAVIFYPVRAQILPVLTGFAQCFPGGFVGDGGDPKDAMLDYQL